MILNVKPTNARVIDQFHYFSNSLTEYNALVAYNAMIEYGGADYTLSPKPNKGVVLSPTPKGVVLSTSPKGVILNLAPTNARIKL